jgi:hypothetical protein
MEVVSTKTRRRTMRKRRNATSQKIQEVADNSPAFGQAFPT